MFKQTQACSDYQLDVTADKFGACKCGFPKADHGVGCGARRPSQERKSSVGDRAAMFGPAGTDKYTTARRPSAGAPAPSGGLPEGWIAQQDPNSGQTFYANTKTGETSWTAPQPAAPVMATASSDQWRQREVEQQRLAAEEQRQREELAQKQQAAEQQRLAAERKQHDEARRQQEEQRRQQEEEALAQQLAQPTFVPPPEQRTARKSSLFEEDGEDADEMLKRIQAKVPGKKAAASGSNLFGSSEAPRSSLFGTDDGNASALGAGFLNDAAPTNKAFQEDLDSPFLRKKTAPPPVPAASADASWKSAFAEDDDDEPGNLFKNA